MKATLEVEIQCSKESCTSDKFGHFCKFFVPKTLGGGICYLFGRLKDVNGQIQRHDKCLQNAKVTET